MRPCIDYTLLDGGASLEQYMELCREAKLHTDVVRSVCVPPVEEILTLCLRETEGSSIAVCAVNDFPYGSGGIARKNEEAVLAYALGVREIDTVINLPALFWYENAVLEEMEKFLYSNPADMRIKVILETAHRWYDETLLYQVSKALADMGFFALKTSTGLKNIDTPAGFLPEISPEEKIRHALIMHRAAPDLHIKVAGGVRAQEDVAKIFAAFADDSDKVIIGTSAPVWK